MFGGKSQKVIIGFGGKIMNREDITIKSRRLRFSFGL
jgi:hypothetical protein